MNFALGLLAFLQMTALPGALLTARLTFDTLTARVTAVFCTSLIFNYALVAGLTACHHFKHGTLLIIVGVEIFLLGRLWWRKTREVSGAARSLGPTLDTFNIVALTLTAVIIGAHGWLWWDELGGVFGDYDAIASWNRWAMMWSKNQWPEGTFNYPQLLPENWSLCYVLTNARSGELFARAVMGGFPMLILLIIADLQRRWRKPWLTVSAAIVFVLLQRMFTPARFDGMADVPVAAISFAGIYFLLLARDAAAPGPFVLLSGIAFGAACVTKQAGLFTSALAIVWVFTDKRLRHSVLLCRRTGLFAISFVVICTVQWYALRMFNGAHQDAALVSHLTGDIHKGRGVLERVGHGLDLLYFYVRSPWFWIAITTSLVTALAHPIGARLLLNFSVPFLLAWLVAFSYDIRNCASALPTGALAAGLGLDRIAVWLRSGLSRLRAGAPHTLLRRTSQAFAVLVLLGLALQISDDATNDSFRAARRRSGDPELNRIIREQTRSGGRILTSYLNLTIQPGFDKRVVYDGRPLADYAVKAAQFAWLVIEQRPGKEEEDVLQRLTLDGSLRNLGTSGGYVLYRNTRVSLEEK